MSDVLAGMPCSPCTFSASLPLAPSISFMLRRPSCALSHADSARVRCDVCLLICRSPLEFGPPLFTLGPTGGSFARVQLRLHGGSNNYLLPTSLLQSTLTDADPSSAFAGGVVRVEATNLHWVGNTFAEHMG